MVNKVPIKTGILIFSEMWTVSLIQIEFSEPPLLTVGYISKCKSNLEYFRLQTSILHLPNLSKMFSRLKLLIDSRN